MARKRDYKAEYQRRIERGLAKGLSRSQARGHPKAGETPARAIIKQYQIPDPKLEDAFKHLRSGMSLVKAAKAAKVSRERFRRYVKSNGLAEWKGRRWNVTDQRMRKVATLSKGRQLELTVPDFEQASKAGKYWNAAGKFVRTNDIGLLDPFQGESIQDAKGRLYPLETAPN